MLVDLSVSRSAALACGAILLTASLWTKPARPDALSRNLGIRAESNWRLRPSAVHLHAGFGTPVGLIGLQLEHNLDEHLGIAVGTGYSIGGIQGAVEALARPFVWQRNALLLTPGLSVGRFEGNHLGFFPDGSRSSNAREYRVEPGFWLNLGAAYEFRGDTGLLFRAYSGYSVLLNHGDLQCQTSATPPAPCANPPRLVFPYLGAALGRAF
jgi:hypothetical protein